MPWLMPSVIATLVGTAILAFTYVYLYAQDRKDYLAAWALSWGIYFLRYAFMLVYIGWYQSDLLLIGNQVASLTSGVMLLYGTYLFVGRPFKRTWLVLTGVGVCWIVVSISFKLPFFIMSLPTFSFLAVVYCWTGRIIIRSPIIRGNERKITGWAFILWGLHKANYPFLRPVTWFAPYGYLLGALFEFVVALGMLMVYFQKTRSDLARSEAVHRQMVANISDVIAILDPRGRTKYISPNVTRWFGWRSDELIGTDGWLTVHPEDLRRVRDEFSSVLAQSGDSKVAVYRYRCKDETYRWIELTAVNLIHDPIIGGVLVNYRDITERRRAETALKESEERFELAMASASDGIFDWDLETNTIYYSPGWKSMLGYADHEIENAFSAWERLTRPEDVASSWEMLKAVIDGKRDRFEKEFRMRHKDGHWVDILSRANVYFDASGKGVRVVGTHVDITERKEAERTLRARAAQHRSIIKTALDGFWMTDMQGRMLEVNEAYCRMSGYDEAELLEMRIPDLEHVENEDDVRRHIQRIIAQGQDRFESRHRRKDGSFVDVEVSVQYWSSDGGRFISFIRDITERIAGEERLRQSQKMESIGHLAGGIAHDFNNLLFPIIGLAEMLAEDLPHSSQERRNALEILKAGKRGSDLVKQILAFSRQSTPQKGPVRIQKVLADALQLSRATIPADIDIQSNIQDDCGLVMGDPSQIHQIIMNLITNAYHAVNRISGKIRVSLEEKGGGAENDGTGAMGHGRLAVLTIADNGCGIAPAILDNVFDPYFTTKEPGKGTGLGLAVVYGIVKEHGGTITLESQPEAGTTVTVSLPLITQTQAQLPEAPTRILQRGSERILLVDDESAVADLEKQMLERLGYRVSVCTGSVDALEAFRAAPEAYDLVVTDMTMPNLTGEALGRAMLEIRPGIPIILCTGYSEQITQERAEALGFSGFAMKPMLLHKISEIVRTALANRPK